MKITIEKNNTEIKTIIDYEGKVFEKEYSDPVKLYHDMMKMLPILLEGVFE